MVRGGVDLDSEEINNQLYKYMAHVEICKMMIVQSILKSKIDTECRIELRKITQMMLINQIKQS